MVALPNFHNTILKPLAALTAGVYVALSLETIPIRGTQMTQHKKKGPSVRSTWSSIDTKSQGSEFDVQIHSELHREYQANYISRRYGIPLQTALLIFSLAVIGGCTNE